MDEFIRFYNALMSGSLPSREIETGHYIVTVSADHNKVKMENKHTHEVFTMSDFTDRERTLLACLAVLEGLHDQES